MGIRVTTWVVRVISLAPPLNSRGLTLKPKLLKRLDSRETPLAFWTLMVGFQTLLPQPENVSQKASTLNPKPLNPNP